MFWIKKGIIYDEFHAQVPVVDTHHNGFWRIYYSQRENRGPSLPYYLDVEPGNPSNILSKSSEPILKLGAKGYFDWAGIMPTEIIQKGELKYFTFDGRFPNLFKYKSDIYIFYNVTGFGDFGFTL